MTNADDTSRGDEPTRADLDAIEAEWPVIAAELEVVEADCRLARMPSDPLAQRARRRAIRSLLAVVAKQTSHAIHHHPATSASATSADAA